MGIEYELHGIRFRWNAAKARSNLAKHGVSFEQAAQVFFDPFVRYFDASRQGEERDGALGCDFEFHILFVVYMLFADDFIRIISAREAEPSERRFYEDGDN